MLATRTQSFEHIEKVWYAHGTQSGTLWDWKHILDMAHFLVGEITAVSGLKTYNRYEKEVRESPLISADECTIAILEFKNGAVGRLNHQE